MKVVCPSCKKGFQIPDDRLQKGRKIAFNCPACRVGRITIDLRSPEAIALAAQLAQARTDAAPVQADTPRAEDYPRGEALKALIVKSLQDLPPMPQVVFKAKAILADTGSGLKELTRVLETDQAMVSKILRLANSAYYGLSGKVSSVQQASVLLGARTLSELISMAGISSLLGSSLRGYKLKSGDLWHHSMAVAAGSKIIAARKHPALEEEAFVAGLIHDAGKIILDAHIISRKKLFERFLADSEKTFLAAEQEILGFDHSEIASEVCRKWNIPGSITKEIGRAHV